MGQELVNEIEAIVLDLLLRRHWDLSMVLKLITKVITDVRPKFVLYCPRISRGTVSDDGDKKMSELDTCLHMPCLF